MVEITRADADERDHWDRHVERSVHGTVFHRLAALEIQAEQAGATLHPLVGRKGQEVVGLFPLFELRKGPITAAFSPPPELRVPYLGPTLVNVEKLSQRKVERRTKRFIDGCFEWMRAELSPRYLHVRTDYRFDDLRPFLWNDCEVTPTYTYAVDLTPGIDEVKKRFSSDARRNVSTDGTAPAHVVEEGNVEDARRINEQVRNRYESQGITYHLDDGFVTALHDRLPDGHVRPYVCRVEGEFVGGLLALEFGDTVTRWQGGVKTDIEVDLAVNDLLDWQVMVDAVERGLFTYDLAGADTPRINRYKAKFGPELAAAHAVEKGFPGMKTAATLYRQLRG